MNKFSFHILPIIHAYNAGISWPRLYARLQWYIPTLDALLDSGRCHDSGRLRSMSVPHVIPPQRWKTSHGRARWLHHLTAQTLCQKQTKNDAWLDQHSKPQYLTASDAQVVRPCAAWPVVLRLAWSERYMSIHKNSVPLQLGQIKVFECLVRWANALCHTTMALRTNHTWEKYLAQQIEQGLDLSHQKLRMLYELSAWCPQSWALS
jgi:hypothetical protein